MRTRWEQADFFSSANLTVVLKSDSETSTFPFKGLQLVTYVFCLGTIGGLLYCHVQWGLQLPFHSLLVLRRDKWNAILDQGYSFQKRKSPWVGIESTNKVVTIVLFLFLRHESSLRLFPFRRCQHEQGGDWNTHICGVMSHHNIIFAEFLLNVRIDLEKKVGFRFERVTFRFSELFW